MGANIHRRGLGRDNQDGLRSGVHMAEWGQIYAGLGRSRRSQEGVGVRS